MNKKTIFVALKKINLEILGNIMNNISDKIIALVKYDE